MNKSIKYRVVIVEPSPLVRLGLRAMLSESNSFEVAGEFADIQAFNQGVIRDGFDAMIINPIVISSYKRFSIRNVLHDHNEKTIVALVSGYVDADTLNSFDAVADIYDDEAAIIRKIRKEIESGEHGDDTSDNIELSDREKEILTAVAKGMTNKEIADRYNISAHTVISHRKNITRKTGIKTVSGLTLYAAFNNLISEDDI